MNRLLETPLAYVLAPPIVLCGFLRRLAEDWRYSWRA